jgi:ADP-ribose pyrophosphatase YjhB (NUDIX family)
LDCIIFGFDKDGLKVLLIKRNFEPEKGKWSLIGGFLKKEEILNQAASRILKRLTGLEKVFMEQLFVFGEIDRDPVERTLSVAYYALIDIQSHDKELIQEYSAKWFLVKDAPLLIFDHNKMLEKAIARLRRKARSKPIGFELLPDKFTMPQLQMLYESILDKKLDKRNFISKINGLKILKKLDQKDMQVSKKGAFLYRFDKDKYDQKVLDGFNFKI